MRSGKDSLDSYVPASTARRTLGRPYNAQTPRSWFTVIPVHENAPSGAVVALARSSGSQA